MSDKPDMAEIRSSNWLSLAPAWFGDRDRGIYFKGSFDMDYIASMFQYARLGENGLVSFVGVENEFDNTNAPLMLRIAATPPEMNPDSQEEWP